MPPGLGDYNSYIAKRSEHSLLPNRCVSIADLGQTSRTISGVDKVREPAPSRTSSPSVGSFQDLATRMPRQDNSVANKVTPQLTRIHIPTEWHLLPLVSSKFQECTHPLCNMIPSYPRRRLTPLLMRCSFERGAQNPETTCNGKRGSHAMTRKSMGG